ncbi:peptidylprolyl isomerase [Echinicola jeungdonensis]|uniref:Peptidyl-prolyl cis-trans isomerase n=1 Tax=Echinicola jeungdonensis TaxID=709343 RepID=A0ABV5J5A4_9BACT|nr:peptidylprolyl isomerase [Echinicola jeungdonensis]MDN3668696.1 peptidylprolyl isomerase [Echinicola jeungdonensis]
MKKLFIVALALTTWISSCTSEKDALVKIQTRHGNIYAVLYDQTPKHKENFIELAQAGRFDSTEFHRIIDNFMIQAGDVFNKEELPEEEWYTLPSEPVEDLIHEKGALGAARQGDHINPERRSSGCQFYIVQGKVYDKKELVTDMKRLQQTFMKYIGLESNKPLENQYKELYEFGDFSGINDLMLSKKAYLEEFYNLNLDKKLSPKQITTYTSVGGTPHLDEMGYTVFGKVVKGLDVVDKIAEEKTNAKDQPIDPVYITVTVEEVSKTKITEEYGFEYQKNE